MLVKLSELEGDIALVFGKASGGGLGGGIVSESSIPSLSPCLMMYDVVARERCGLLLTSDLALCLILAVRRLDMMEACS